MRLFRLDTLDLYIVRRFLTIYAANLVCFNLLFALIDGLGHFRGFTEDRAAGEAVVTFFGYYAAILPLIFCQILGPVCSVCAALFCVTTFERSNEFVPILASGRSHQRTLSPILAASLAITVGTFLVQELWIPRTVSAIRSAHESLRRGGDENVMFPDAYHGNLIVFATYDSFERTAGGVLVIPFPRRPGPAQFYRADKARWIEPPAAEREASQGHWELQNGVVQEYGPDGLLVTQPPESEGGRPTLWREFERQPLKSTLWPQDIQHRSDEAVYMTLSELRHKADTSPDRSGWQTKYYSRFAYPLVNFVLVLLGLPVIIRFGSRNIFFGALVALAVSTSYFIANSICQDLSIDGVLPVRLGAGLAPIFFTALGATFYRDMRS